MSEKEKTLDVEKKEVTPVEGTERMSSRKSFVPRTDIYENDEKVFVVAAVPGVDEKSIEIYVEKNILNISGAVQPETMDNHALVYAEYEDGDYHRKFTLSNEIDIDHIEATVKDGVLRLFLPKVTPSTKKIAVKAGN
jgi:HSP20 family molecular chaperone IbpA